MRVVGFNFTKISAEKMKNSVKDLKVNTDIDVPEIRSIKSDLFKDGNDLIEAKFVHLVNYSPDFAKIVIEGKLVLSAEPKIAKKILKDWKKKKINEEFRIFLFNMVLKRSTIKALELEESLNLPFHVPIPSLRKQENN